MGEISVVDWHHFGDMDPDLDPTFQLDADPDPILSFIHAGKSEIFFRFLITAVPVYSVSDNTVPDTLKFSGKVKTARHA